MADMRGKEVLMLREDIRIVRSSSDKSSQLIIHEIIPAPSPSPVVS